jgi:HAD superfamily hydrolase (TIGR01509 family)
MSNRPLIGACRMSRRDFDQGREAGFDALFLDFDGVLVDSEPIWWSAIDDVFQGRGCLAPGNHVERRPGYRVEEAIAHLIGNDELLVKSISEDVKRLAEARIVDEPLADGAVEVIHEVSAADVTLGVVSSSHLALVEKVLQAKSVRNHFSVLVGGDRVKKGKPAPDSYILAAEEAGVLPARCCAVEDSATGILAAAKAGVYVVQYARPSEIIDDDAQRHIGTVVSRLNSVIEVVLRR